MQRALLASALGVLLSASTVAQDREEWRAMNRPIAPFRIAGPLYYVGASDVTSFLVTTPAGHVLIDGGFVETVPLIRDSIAKLGFKIDDVRILLNSHAHTDHAGGLAALKAMTGAKLYASERDTPLLERGGRGDDVMGDAAAYPPVTVDRRLADGDRVELGGMVLTARVTAGHTRGCTSWDFEVDDEGVRRRVVSVCSLSILPGARLTGERPSYPGIASDYERSISVLEALPAEIFLAPHGSFFELDEKRALASAAGKTNPFVDPERYRRYLDHAKAALAARLAAERAAP